MAYGLINADQIGTSVANTSLGAGDASLLKNRIINGAMVIDQRNAGASVTGNNDVFGVDRFKIQASQSSKMTVQQNAGSVTPPAGFKNYLGITSTSAYTVLSGDYFTLEQPIEGYNIADLDWGTANAKTVTLSFWVRSSLTGTFGGVLQNINSYSYPFTYTISSANTWEQKSITVTGATTSTWGSTNGTGIRVHFGLGIGTTYAGTAGSWASANLLGATGEVNVVSTNGATWYVTGVQLEVGSSATGFEYRQFGQELALCQRYFTKSYDTATVPATATSVGAIWSTGGSDSSGNGYYSYRFPVTMRTAPTMTGYRTDGYGGYWNYERSGSSGSNTVQFDNIANSGGRLYTANGGSGFAVTLIYGQWIATAEL